MKKRYNQRHKPIHFNVGDYVYLRLWKAYNIPTNKSTTRKLGQAYAGRFRMLERVGRLAYRLDLPSAMKLHNVISVELLEPAPKDVRDEGNPVLTVDDRFPEQQDRFDVEAILDKRVRAVGRSRKPVTFYLIRWKNAGPEHDEWVHERNAVGAEEKIADFEQQQATAAEH